MGTKKTKNNAYLYGYVRFGEEQAFRLTLHALRNENLGAYCL